MQSVWKINKLGEKISYYLNINRWSQQDLADKLKTTQQSVSRWVNGQTEPELDDILLICYWLGKDPNEFLGFNDISKDELKKYATDRISK